LTMVMAGGEPRVLFAEPGFLVFSRGANLFAQPFDAKRLRLSGTPVQIAEQVAGTLDSFVGRFSAVRDAVAYLPGTSATVLTWVDRKGNPGGTVGAPAEYTNPVLSPDGRTVAVSRRDPSTNTRDIWLFDVTRGSQSRLTFDPADESNATWSPDGNRIAFMSSRKGQRDIYVKAASGVGEEKELLVSDLRKNPEDWSPDGKVLLFNFRDPARPPEVWALPMEGGGEPYPLLAGPAEIQQAQLSPDGKFVVYRSMETGRTEIYVQSFPPGAGRWQISTEGGTNPQWRSDGKELYYLQNDRLMAVPIRSSDLRLEAGKPELLFEAPFGPTGRSSYVPSRDGQRFLVNMRAEQPGHPLTVVLNWASELKR
jgi:eukaryotic-like serine/threonine-protein kinase